MKFRDENQDETPSEGGDFMAEIRELLNKKDPSQPMSEDEIKTRFGAETLGMVVRVQDRMDLLVDAMHEFLQAREEGGDTTSTLTKFTRLMQETVIKYSPMEVGSMLSAGMTAIAELERRFGKPDSE